MMNKFYTLKQIETPRLIIRPVQLGDEIQHRLIPANDELAVGSGNSSGTVVQVHQIAAAIIASVLVWADFVVPAPA